MGKALQKRTYNTYIDDTDSTNDKAEKILNRHYILRSLVYKLESLL